MIVDADLAAAQRRLRLAGPADRLAAQRHLIVVIAKMYGFTMVERTVMPAGAAAYFNWQTNTATGPPIVDDVTFGTWLHEFGHGVCGACPNRAPHLRHVRESRWVHCLECERLAWEVARRWVPFTAVMFHDLQVSLDFYRRRTPAPASAIAKATAAVDFTEAFARPWLRGVEQQLRQQRVEESLRDPAIRVDEEIRRQKTIYARQLARQHSHR